jgi:hypothetical protein
VRQPGMGSHERAAPWPMRGHEMAVPGTAGLNPGGGGVAYDVEQQWRRAATQRVGKSCLRLLVTVKTFPPTDDRGKDRAMVDERTLGATVARCRIRPSEWYLMYEQLSKT